MASRKRIDMEKRSDKRFEGEAYSYSRAFTYMPGKCLQFIEKRDTLTL